MLFNILLAFCTVIIIIFGIFVFSCEMNERKLNTMYESKEEVFSGEKRTALLLFQPFEPLKEENEKIKNFVLDFFKEHNYNIKANYPTNEIKYNAEEFDVIVLIAYEYRNNIGKPMIDFIEESAFIEKNILLITIGKNLNNTSLLDKLKNDIDSSNNLFTLKTTTNDTNDLNDLLNKYFK